MSYISLGHLARVFGADIFSPYVKLQRNSNYHICILNYYRPLSTLVKQGIDRFSSAI
jgi:hypothetical protein